MLQQIDIFVSVIRRICCCSFRGMAIDKFKIAVFFLVWDFSDQLINLSRTLSTKTALVAQICIYPEASVDRVSYNITDLFRESLMYDKYTLVAMK